MIVTAVLLSAMIMLAITMLVMAVVVIMTTVMLTMLVVLIITVCLIHHKSFTVRHMSHIHRRHAELLVYETRMHRCRYCVGQR
jgi:hypothetical protein